VTICRECGREKHVDPRKTILDEVSRVSRISRRAIMSKSKMMRTVNARVALAVLLAEHLHLRPSEVTDYFKGDRANWYYWKKLAEERSERGQRIRHLIIRARRGLR